MGTILAVLATLAAGLVLFVAMGMVLIGIGYGYDSPRDLLIYGGVLAVLAGILISNGMLAFALWQQQPARKINRIVVVVATILAVIFAVWSIVVDPGDAPWTVPPLLLYAGCSVIALRSTGRVGEAS